MHKHGLVYVSLYNFSHSDTRSHTDFHTSSSLIKTQPSKKRLFKKGHCSQYSRLNLSIHLTQLVRNKRDFEEKEARRRWWGVPCLTTHFLILSVFIILSLPLASFGTPFVSCPLHIFYPPPLYAHTTVTKFQLYPTISLLLSWTCICRSGGGPMCGKQSSGNRGIERSCIAYMQGHGS